jgi:hypothetical protein
MEMDRLLYGSPGIAVLRSRSVDIPTDFQGEEPTSDDEEAWRDQLEVEMAGKRVAECSDAENRTRQGLEHGGTEEGSSPFEEAQRPPWHGRLTLRELTPSGSADESSEDEIVRIWVQDGGSISRLLMPVHEISHGL